MTTTFQAPETSSDDVKTFEPQSVVVAEGRAGYESETVVLPDVAEISHEPSGSMIDGTNALTEIPPAVASQPADVMNGTTGPAGEPEGVGAAVAVGIGVAVPATGGVFDGDGLRVGVGVAVVR